MDVTQSLRRTFDPKYTHYSVDGHGRDTYINSNNGGLMATKVKNQAFKETQKGKLAFFAPAPRSESWGLTYHSDGSGRDYYIAHNSGGLYSRFSPGSGQKYFKQTLRQPIVRESKDMFSRTTQKWVDFKGRQLLMKNKEIVDGVVKRLASPSPDGKKGRYNMRATF